LVLVPASFVTNCNWFQKGLQKEIGFNSTFSTYKAYLIPMRTPVHPPTSAIKDIQSYANPALEKTFIPY
jgi:hypothetical protein